MWSEGRLSTLLLEKALTSGLSNFEKGSSADFKREILSEVQQVSNFVIYPVLRIAQVLPMVFVTLITLLLLFGLYSIFYLLSALVLGWLTYLSIKTASTNLGKIRFQANELRFQYLETAFSNIRLIMILSLSKNVVKNTL